MEPKVVISGKEMEEAEVVWCNFEKRFGFIQIIGSVEQIFFHFNNAKMAQADESTEQLIFKNPTGWLLRDPRIGDVILFVRSVGKGGRPKASPWISFDSWMLADFQLSDLIAVCGSCSHKISDHAGGWECMKCDCGNEEYEHQQSEFQQVWYGEEPGGSNYWE